MKAEFKILAERHLEVVASLNKMFRKAKRFETGDMSWSFGPVFIEKHSYYDSVNERTVVTRVPYEMLTFEGETPRVNGWTFIARMEFVRGDEKVQTLAQCVPGETVPVEYLTTDSHCDHCKSNRYRKDVFVLRSEAGEHMQVGRQCLQDFLGNDPNKIIGRFQFEAQLQSFMEGERDYDPNSFAYDPVELLTATAAVIRMIGWKSKTAAQDEEARTGYKVESTSSIVRLKFSTSEEDRKKFKLLIGQYMNEGDEKLAVETLAWARALTGTSNEYLHNLNVILSAEFVYQPKHIGLAVSAVSAFLREKQRQEELNTKSQQNAKSEWLGKEKERLRDIPVRLEQAIAMPESQWGFTTLYKFRDENGNILITITGSGMDLGINEAGLLTGTVKRHNEYNGAKQTQLSRVVVTPVCVKKESA